MLIVQMNKIVASSPDIQCTSPNDMYTDFEVKFLNSLPSSRCCLYTGFH